MAAEPSQDQLPGDASDASDFGRVLRIVVPLLAVAVGLLLWLLVAVVLSAVVAVEPAHAQGAAESASQLAGPMTTYQSIIAAVAIGNLGLTVLLLLSNRNKAAADRLESLERALRDELISHSSELIRLRSALESAPSHNHLEVINREIKSMAQLVNVMHGEQVAMNALLRQLIGNRIGGHAP